MTDHDHTTSGRRSFVARLIAGAGALAAAVSPWGRSPSPASAAGPASGPAAGPATSLRVRPHPDAVPRTSEQSTTNG
jgi:hypothetical protein